jgi:glycosyltransferase involved in cell wall biosynthesis
MASDSRIAFFFSTSGHSGVDRAVRNLLQAIVRRGYPIDLLHVRNHGPSTENLPADVRVIDLGVRHTDMTLPALVRYLRRERPTVMLSDKDRVNRMAVLGRWFAGTDNRLVLSSGTTISIDLSHRSAWERWLQHQSMSRLYPLADKIITTCEGAADDLAAFAGLKRDTIEVVPSPVVPAALFTETQPIPDHPWFSREAPPVILGVGELGMRKDFATLIRAFALLKHSRECRLLILGRGRQREELLRLAGELGVAEDVDLPGFVSNPYAFMAHAALFAFTSLWEGLGFVIIEALAVGTPVVAMDCPSGPREILQAGRYGKLVALGDTPALAEAMASTLDDPPPRDLLREAAMPYEIERSASAYLRALGLDPRESDMALGPGIEH